MINIDYLERLHRLHQAGALTTEEFEREKEKILKNPPQTPTQNIVPYQPIAPLGNKKNEATDAAFLHLLLFIPIVGWLLSFFIWYTKREQNPQVQEEGISILFLFLSSFIYLLIGYCFVLFFNNILDYDFFPLYSTLTLIYYCIVLIYAGFNTNNLNKGKTTEYPMTLVFLKNMLPKDTALPKVESSYTMQNIGHMQNLTIEKQPTANIEEDITTYTMIMHLALFVPFINWLIILLMWLTKKEESPFVKQHGTAIINLLLSVLVYVGIYTLLLNLILLYVSTARGLFFFGTSLFIGLIMGFLLLVAIITNAANANKGQPARYPMAIKFLKDTTLVDEAK